MTLKVFKLLDHKLSLLQIFSYCLGNVFCILKFQFETFSLKIISDLWPLNLGLDLEIRSQTILTSDFSILFGQCFLYFEIPVWDFPFKDHLWPSAFKLGPWPWKCVKPFFFIGHLCYKCSHVSLRLYLIIIIPILDFLLKIIYNFWPLNLGLDLESV